MLQRDCILSSLESSLAYENEQSQFLSVLQDTVHDLTAYKATPEEIVSYLPFFCIVRMLAIYKMITVKSRKFKVLRTSSFILKETFLKETFLLRLQNICY